MDRFWAPWRLEYVQGARAEQCIFCLPEDPGEDAGRLVLYRGPTCFIIMNRFPYANGHLMVAPRRHLADPAQLSCEEAAELHRLTVLCQQLLRSACRAQGFNVGMNIGEVAGAGVADHLHQHVVPRWAGDTNFMPVFAEVRVIPQHLDATFRLLREELAGRLGNAPEFR